MTYKKLFFAALLGVSSLCLQAVTPTLVYRSQGRHADRQKMVGETMQTNLNDKQSWYGTMDIGVGYMSSFKPKQIARSLFGNDILCDGCAPTILVQGSGVDNRDAKAWLADYMYLNCDFNGRFTIKPRIKNVVVDLDFYLGLDKYKEGMYFRIYGPITWTKWQTNFCSTDTGLTSSCSVGGMGYYTQTGTEVLLSSISQYFQGQAPSITSDGVIFQGLKYAKIPACDETKTGFAELRAELGWNFIQNDDYHLGFNIQAAAPTGTHRYADYVMNPVVGNGHHWELGGGLGFHYIFYRSSDEERNFGFYVDANLTHLFKVKENRTFDLKDKPNSRYMLAAAFTNGVKDVLAGKTAAGTGVATDYTRATSQFAKVYSPLANLTTADVNVSVGVQADIVAMFNFTSGNFGWDFGYNFWGRSCEKIECPIECGCEQSLFSLSQQNTWVLKGDARMFGYMGEAGANLAANSAVALSASQNSANIHRGTNATSDSPIRNFGVDNAQFAVADTTGLRLIHTPTTAGGFNVNSDQIKTSIQPIFVSSDDILVQETKGMSHKIFTHLNYTWDREEWIPYLGVGGSAEFGMNSSSCGDNSTSGDCCTSDCSTDCNSCDNCTKASLTQWAVWVKGGLSFN